jgi:hypothetical protein
MWKGKHQEEKEKKEGRKGGRETWGGGGINQKSKSVHVEHVLCVSQSIIRTFLFWRRKRMILPLKNLRV